MRIIKWFKVLLHKRLGKRGRLCIKNHHIRFAHYPHNRYLRLLLSFIAIIQTTKYALPYVEMDVTSRCSLNCKECSHFIPLHKSEGVSYDYEVNELLENIELLVSKIDSSFIFRLVGGEPFLYKQLYLVINKLVKQKKIKHIQIVTNGTIIPQGENIAALSHAKVSVRISNYGVLSAKKDELVAVFKSNHIRHYLDTYQPIWRKTDGLVYRGYSDEEMKNIFANCNVAKCKTLYKGALWLCPLAFHGVYLGLVKKNQHEFIDLRNCTKDEFWRKLNKMYTDSDGMTTCYYCSGGDLSSAEKIPAAEQV